MFSELSTAVRSLDHLRFCSMTLMPLGMLRPFVFYAILASSKHTLCFPQNSFFMKIASSFSFTYVKGSETPKKVGARGQLNWMKKLYMRSGVCV